MGARRKNFGLGYGYKFHGAFKEKSDAVAKESKTKGSYIIGRPTNQGYRWIVMSPRTNPVKRRRNGRKLIVGDKTFKTWASARNYALKQAKNFNNRIPVLVVEKDGSELTQWVDPPAQKNPGPRFNRSAETQRKKARKLYLQMSELLAAGKLERSNKVRMRLAKLNAKMGWDMAYVADFSRAHNPAELIVLGANPAELIVLGANGRGRSNSDDPWMVKAAAELYPGLTIAQLSAERDQLSRVLQLAAELKREAGGGRKNVEFGEYEKGIFHPWTRRVRTRRKKAVLRRNGSANPDRYSSAHARAAGIERQAPGLIRTKGQKRVAGMVRGARKHKLDWAEEFGRGVRERGLNPSAADLRETFVGAPANHYTVRDEPHMPAGDYAQLGELLALYVKPRAGSQVQQITFRRGARPLLLADETARQMYFAGGDQDVSSSLEVFGARDRGDGVYLLGELRRIDYKQRKEHVPDPDVDEWRHELGEENGIRPELLFDLRRQRFLLEGGDYEVRAEGIVN